MLRDLSRCTFMFTSWAEIISFVELLKNQATEEFELVELKNMFKGWEKSNSK